MRAWLLALVAVAGCHDSGWALDVTVEPGCVTGASDVEIDVVLTPGAAAATTRHEDAVTFFAGQHRVVVLPPDGTSAVTVSVTATNASGLRLGTGTVTAAVRGARVDHETLTLGSAQCPVDGGAPPDLPPGVCLQVTPDAEHFVDQLLGTDDDQHGGAPGACAYKSLAYALGHATGVISLKQDNYSGNVVLSGQQQLFCNQSVLFAPTTGGEAILLNGTANVVSGCVVRGNFINIEPTNLGQHVIEDCDVSGFDLVGIQVSYGSMVTVRNNYVHDSTANAMYGIYVGSSGTTTLTGNRFGNVHGADIACAQSSTVVTGSGNTDGTGAPTCLTCAGCPFP